MQYVRFLSNWAPHRAGECLEVDDTFGAVLGPAFVEAITPAEYQEHIETMAMIDRGVERAVDRHSGIGIDRDEIVRQVKASMSKADRRVTEEEWKREIGFKGPSVLIKRYAMLAPASLDDDERTVDLDAATATPVRRREYDFLGGNERVYDEVLDMSPASVRLERLNNGAPFLDSHNHNGGTRAMLGVIVPGSARVRDSKLVARAKFSRSEDGERAFQDAKDGILRKVSVGYLIHKRKIDDTRDPPVHHIVDWEPHEISAVSIPADQNAGFRSERIRA